MSTAPISVFDVVESRWIETRGNLEASQSDLGTESMALQAAYSNVVAALRTTRVFPGERHFLDKAIRALEEHQAALTAWKARVSHLLSDTRDFTTVTKALLTAYGAHPCSVDGCEALFTESDEAFPSCCPAHADNARWLLEQEDNERAADDAHTDGVFYRG